MEDSKKKLLLFLIAALRARKKIKNRKTIWCKRFLLARELKGSYNNIFKELRELPHYCDFETYARMPVVLFDELLGKVASRIKKQDTHLREAISPGARLEATLRFLTTGLNYRQLQYHTRISPQSLSRIIPETCRAIFESLKMDYMQVTINCSSYLLLHGVSILMNGCDCDFHTKKG